MKYIILLLGTLISFSLNAQTFGVPLTDSTAIDAFDFATGAHTVDTNIDSVGIAALGYESGVTTIFYDPEHPINTGQPPSGLNPKYGDLYVWVTKNQWWRAIEQYVNNLSLGTATATTVPIEIVSGSNITLLEANTNDAGLLGADKWDEIVANTAKTGITAQQAADITTNNAKVSGQAYTYTAVKTTNYTAAIDDFITVSGDDFTITKPSSPSVGDRFAVSHKLAGTYDAVKVDFGAGNYYDDYQYSIVRADWGTQVFIYSGATLGWVNESGVSHPHNNTGGISFTDVGSTTWYPEFSGLDVSIVLISGGEGGDEGNGVGGTGGALVYLTSYVVTADDVANGIPLSIGAGGALNSGNGGDTWFKSSSYMLADGGDLFGQTNVGGTASYKGGLDGNPSGGKASGGGGCAGYSANGGKGGDGGGNGIAATGGGGGGGEGANVAGAPSQGGGGTGIFGAGANGSANGGGGSGGANAAAEGTVSPTGALYGGGGAGAYTDGEEGLGGQGAARIIWGSTYPTGG
jgi:hypothetical protein